ncbi:YcdB/YcdC domain-containing protein [Tissierella praeacuta]|uniref:YcdB/YcdC domain-containing protein n=1 Tax=Tissierella praeacuta TaxID=43131 RepID=UPI0033404A56
MKKISIILLAAMMFIGGVVPIRAYGENNYDKKMEEVVVKVKKLLNISDKYDKFTSDISSYDGNMDIYLNWADSNEKLNNINVHADIDGNIISYDSYSPINKEQSSKLPKYTKDEAQKLAMNFINKMDSNIANAIKLIPDKYSENTMDTVYRFNFIRFVNGIQFPQDSVSISINKYTGDIEHYYANWDRKATFPSPNKVLSLEKGKEAYKTEIGIKPMYKTSSRYIIKAGENTNYYLAYSVFESNKGIDAYTGKKVGINSYGPYYGVRESTNQNSANDVGLTPVEQESVDKLSGLLEENLVEKKARETLNIDLDYKMIRKDLYNNFRNPGEYIWNIDFQKEISKDKSSYINVGLDAKTGELLNFNKNLEHGSDAKSKTSKDKALDIAREYIKTMQPNKISEIELMEDQYSEDNMLNYNFRFIRKVGNTYVENDGIYIGVDGVTGDVNNYRIDWFKGELPSDYKLISSDKAYEILWDKIGLELMYVKTYDYTKSQGRDYEMKLVYMTNQDKPIIISGTTGEILDYSGQPYKEIKPISYKDIENSYAKNKIITLAEYGIGFKGEEFKPKDKIKQKDFLHLLWKSMNQYRKDEVSEDDIYKELISSGYMKEAEKNPNKVVTKEEAVKHILRVMKLDKVAEIEGIYKDIFKDDKDISKGLNGYMNIAYGLKIVSGDKEGNIRPKYELGREDAANMIYNYIFNQ